MPTHYKGHRCVAATFSELCGVGRKEWYAGGVLRAETGVRPEGSWVADFKTLPLVEWFCAPGASLPCLVSALPVGEALRGVWCPVCRTRAPWSLEAE